MKFKNQILILLIAISFASGGRAQQPSENLKAGGVIGHVIAPNSVAPDEDMAVEEEPQDDFTSSSSESPTSDKKASGKNSVKVKNNTDNVGGPLDPGFSSEPNEVKAETKDAKSAEKKASEISKFYQGRMSSEKWASFLKNKLNQQYSIREGDTLWDISKSLFGNNFIWPKLWSVNNQIGNPHILEKESKIRFVMGDEPMPQLITDSGIPQFKDEHGPEYKMLGEGRFQNSQHMKKRNVDELGFDTQIISRTSSPSKQLVLSFPSGSDRIAVGLITSSPQERSILGVGDSVFVKGTQNFQPGKSYSIVRNLGPMAYKNTRNNANHLRIIGTVEVSNQKVQNDLYVGKITQSFDNIARGTELYTVMPTSVDSLSGAGSSSGKDVATRIVEAAESRSRRSVGPGEMVFIDAGSGDGLSNGQELDLIEADRVNTIALRGSYIFGKARVLKVFETMAIAFVLSTDRDIPMGTVVKSHSILQKNESEAPVSDQPTQESAPSLDEPLPPPPPAEDNDLPSLDEPTSSEEGNPESDLPPTSDEVGVDEPPKPDVQDVPPPPEAQPPSPDDLPSIDEPAPNNGDVTNPELPQMTPEEEELLKK